MIYINFLKHQLLQIQRKGFFVYWIKIGGLRRFLHLPLCVFAIPFVFIIRLIKPWFLVRMGGLISLRIGHFAANTELYLCERDAGINVPKQRYVDIFHMAHRPICNRQLEIMWKRTLNIWPSWVLGPIILANRIIAGGAIHEIGENTRGDRDVHNLLDQFPPHLEFSPKEEASGAASLREMGIPEGVRFVCFIVRDSSYLDSIPLYRHLDLSYHSYRDCNIQNYVLAAEELAERGYYVIRMGAKVKEAFNVKHPNIIDYAFNGMRSDFMDIYLGAKCTFCVTVGTGFDSIPFIFRRPIVDTNFVPLGFCSTSSNRFLHITKHHYSIAENRTLTLKEIFDKGLGCSYATNKYSSKGVQLLENTPEEIRDVVVEMYDRLNDNWQPHVEDEALQRRFWEIFPDDELNDANGQPYHGEIRSHYGAKFLRDKKSWLQ